MLSGLGGVAGIAGGLADDFLGGLADMRDALYATEYVTGMFSHYAYEREARYALLSDEDREGVTWANSETVCERVTGDAATRGTLLSEDPRDTYNKSLTCRMINSANNYPFGAELEYILYGGSNSDNIGKAIGAIYAVRYALNTPYAFMAFWGMDNATGRAVNAAAAAISAWSGGVIPAELVKSVIILSLVALETANDVRMLRAGLPVKLIKLYSGGDGDPDWVVELEASGEGGLAPSSRGGRAQSGGARLTYGDYLYVFLLLGFGGDGDLAKAMYARTGDIVQVNVRHVAGGDAAADYRLDRAAVYLRIAATVRVEPLMLGLSVAADHTGDPYGKVRWRTISYDAVRGSGG
jgi:hypothetical protein